MGAIKDICLSECLALLLISSLPPCRFTCILTNRGPFHVSVQDKHIKNMSCGEVGPHAKQAENSSAEHSLKLFLAARGPDPGRDSQC